MEPEGASFLQPSERRRFLRQSWAAASAGPQLAGGWATGDTVRVREDADSQGDPPHVDDDVAVGVGAPGLVLDVRGVGVEPVGR